jgi:hypothetical protein
MPNYSQEIQMLHRYLKDSPYFEIIKELPDLPTPESIWSRIAELHLINDEFEYNQEYAKRKQRITNDSMQVVREKLLQEIILNSKVDVALENVQQLSSKFRMDICQQLITFYYKKIKVVELDDKIKIAEKLKAQIKKMVEADAAFSENYDAILCAFELNMGLESASKVVGHYTLESSIGFLASCFLQSTSASMDFEQKSIDTDRLVQLESEFKDYSFYYYLLAIGSFYITDRNEETLQYASKSLELLAQTIASIGPKIELTPYFL